MTQFRTPPRLPPRFPPRNLGAPAKQAAIEPVIASSAATQKPSAAPPTSAAAAADKVITLGIMRPGQFETFAAFSSRYVSQMSAAGRSASEIAAVDEFIRQLGRIGIAWSPGDSCIELEPADEPEELTATLAEIEESRVPKDVFDHDAEPDLSEPEPTPPAAPEKPTVRVVLPPRTRVAPVVAKPVVEKPLIDIGDFLDPEDPDVQDLSKYFDP